MIRLVPGSGGFVTLFSSDARSNADSPTHDFEIALSPPIDLSGADRYEVSLMSLNTWFTWFNISVAYDNYRFRYYNGTTWKTVSLEPGNYNAEDLVSSIAALIEAAGDSSASIQIVPDYNNQKFLVTFAAGYKIDFDSAYGNLYLIFGANPVEYSTTGYMPNVAKITNNVNQWNIELNILEGGYSGSGAGKSIFSFAPDVAPGAAINERPLKYYSLVKNQKTVDSIRVRLVDQQRRLISINNEPLDITLHWRPLYYSK